MSTSQPDSPAPSDERATPTRCCTPAPHGEVTAEDLVLAAGRDITPENLAWAERKLAQEGPAALERLLP